jgi:hypothetical protein
VKPKPKINLPRTEMSADEFIAHFEQSVFGATKQEREEAWKWLESTGRKIDENRRKLLGQNSHN